MRLIPALAKLILEPVLAPLLDLKSDFKFRNYSRYQTVVKDQLDETSFTVYVEQKDGSFRSFKAGIDRSNSDGACIYLKPEEVMGALYDAKSI